jgi:hypothetical protein
MWYLTCRKRGTCSIIFFFMVHGDAFGCIVTFSASPKSREYLYPPLGDALDSFSGSALCTINCTHKFPVYSWIEYICKIHSIFLCMYIEVCDVVVFSFVEENIDTPFLLIYAVVNWNAIMFVDREAPSLQKYRNLIALVFTRILRQLIIYFSHKKFLWKKNNNTYAMHTFCNG